MGISLEMMIPALGRLGARCAKPLKGLGVLTVFDLLRHYPFRYDDLSRTVPLSGPTSAPVTVRVRVDMLRTRRAAKRKMMLTEASVSDEAGTAKVVWFRQPFIAKILKPGDRILLSGKLEGRPWGLEMINPVYEKEGFGPSVHTGRLVPIYPLTGSLTAKQLRALLHMALPSADGIQDPLDDATIDRHGLMSLSDAIRAIHFPASKEQATAADRRLRFDELLRFQLRGAWARKTAAGRAGVLVPFQEEAVRAFVAGLPFQLTDDQRKAAWSVLRDMASGTAMQRLLEGDVGSGKTAVAAIAAHDCAEAGLRTLIMAPTEILAEQHCATLKKLYASTPRTVALRTRNHRERLDGADVIVGTHALLEEKLSFKDVALVVVDEQHRFGVDQRHELLARLSGGGAVPHFLSMTATPIPRSLALALYGDVDFTSLRQMPKGRKPVRTELVDESSRARMYGAVRAEAALGRKTFVVCPLIEPSDAAGARSAEEEAERLRKEAFPELEVGLLHGKMKAKEKQETMERFARGDLHVLVSTTVVEVGVDVPLATTMIVEDAERFGLAQLHQLRGRVGRSDLPSTCYLSCGNDSPAARERLEAFMKAADCFELADLDLRLRGPGDIFGTEQSGFADLKRFNPGDTGLIEETKEAAERLLLEDPDLTRHPALRVVTEPEAAKIHLE